MLLFTFNISCICAIPLLYSIIQTYSISHKMKGIALLILLACFKFILLKHVVSLLFQEMNENVLSAIPFVLTFLFPQISSSLLLFALFNLVKCHIVILSSKPFLYGWDYCGKDVHNCQVYYLRAKFFFASLSSFLYINKKSC